MSSENDQNPFRRKVMTRQPGLIGAQWWNEGLSQMSDPVSRRKALQALVVFGGVVGVGGLVLAASGEDEYLELHDYFGRGGNEVMHRLKALRRRAAARRGGRTAGGGGAA